MVIVVVYTDASQYLQELVSRHNGLVATHNGMHLPSGLSATAHLHTTLRCGPSDGFPGTPPGSFHPIIFAIVVRNYCKFEKCSKSARVIQWGRTISRLTVEL